MSFVITSQEPVGSYSTVGAASVDADVDNIGSHTPYLYSSSSGPMQYYNWNENSCDEWLTASTNYWPSDIQIKID